MHHIVHEESGNCYRYNLIKKTGTYQWVIFKRKHIRVLNSTGIFTLFASNTNKTKQNVSMDVVSMEIIS